MRRRRSKERAHLSLFHRGTGFVLSSIHAGFRSFGRSTIFHPIHVIRHNGAIFSWLRVEYDFVRFRIGCSRATTEALSYAILLRHGQPLVSHPSFELLTGGGLLGKINISGPRGRRL
jgi:hypothetical protein